MSPEAPGGVVGPWSGVVCESLLVVAGGVVLPEVSVELLLVESGAGAGAGVVCC